jgi:uncharacterized protein YpmB
MVPPEIIVFGIIAAIILVAVYLFTSFLQGYNEARGYSDD